MTEVTSPQPAATVMLVRDNADRSEIEIFLVKRNVGGAFSGLYVFPGGKVDESDSKEDLLPYVLGIDDKQASTRLQLNSGGLAYWIACVRECFEEAGILLAVDSNGDWVDVQSDSDFARYREQLNQGEDILVEMCEKKQIKLALNRLAYTAHWITPKLEKRRFNTRFFIAGSPLTQTGTHDGAELVNSEWTTPKSALARSKSGEIQMILPTITNLQDIARFNSVDELLADKQLLNPEDIKTVAPVFAKIDGEFVRLLPDDPRYKENA